MKIRISIDINELNKFIDNIICKYHFNENDKELLIEIYNKLRTVITPYAEYRINRHSTGVDIIDKGTATAVAMSLGAGVDRLQERYISEDKLSEAYMIDCISSELLLKMYREFNISYARFHRRYVDRYVFVGEQIPSTDIQQILENIRGKKNDGDMQERKKITDIAESEDSVLANEYGVLTPSKSVVFYAILSENPSTKCQGICMGCGRTDCENRFVVKKQLPEATDITKTVEGYINAGNDVSDKYMAEAEPQNTDKNKINSVIELNYGYQRIFGSAK